VIALALALAFSPGMDGGGEVPPCEGKVVVVWADELDCDVVPPQRLDVVVINEAECLDMGGRIDWRVKVKRSLYCVDVDY
jgi:hypothetical protein